MNQKKRDRERRVDNKILSNVNYLLYAVPIANSSYIHHPHSFLVPPFSVVHEQ